MHKITKHKLTLSKQTLRRLSADDLTSVNGGVKRTNDCPATEFCPITSQCYPTQQNGCQG